MFRYALDSFNTLIVWAVLIPIFIIQYFTAGYLLLTFIGIFSPLLIAAVFTEVGILSGFTLLIYTIIAIVWFCLDCFRDRDNRYLSYCLYQIATWCKNNKAKEILTY